MTKNKEKLFFKAASDGNLTALKDHLIARPNFARARNEDGMTGLMLASREGHQPCVDALLPVSDLTATDGKGWTALLHAIDGGYIGCARELLRVSELSAVEDLLFEAVGEGNLADLETLLEARPGLASACDGDGWTPLMWAANYGQEDCLQALLPLSDPRAIDESGTTTLMLAAQRGHAKCVQALLPVSETFAVNSDGQTALDVAMEEGHRKAASLIRSYATAQVEAGELAAITQPAPEKSVERARKPRGL